MVVFHITAEVEVKLTPVMVSVKAVPPAIAKAGLNPATVGGGGLMVKVTPEDAPPSVLTVMLPVPALAVRAAGIVAVS